MIPSLAVKGHRIEHCIVCRESDQYGYALMEGMIGQTLGRLTHIPGVEDVLAAGIAPLRGEGPFKLFPYRSDKTTAVLFEHLGVLYLYSLGSAATASIGDRENPFVSLLIDVVDIYRPKNVYVATFSRLVRSTEFSGTLSGALQRNRTVVNCAGESFDLNTNTGRIHWGLLSMMADMERNLIVQRLFAGLCNKYARGEFILGAKSLPPGYLLGDDGMVHLDESMIEPVRRLLLLLADFDLSMSDVVREAGRAGVTSPTLKRIYGPDATFGDIRNAGCAMATLMDLIPTYTTGTYDILWKNPFPGAKQIGRVDVEGASETEAGSVRFKYEWEVPEGGWAPPEVLMAARTRARGRKESLRTGGSAHVKRKPLVGMPPWIDGDFRCRLTGESHMYVVVREPLSVTSEVTP
jgi:hypothetical protein